MKNLHELPAATHEETYPGDETDWAKDRLIDRLNSENRYPIFLGRAIAVIEQCDVDDDFPEGANFTPLKISIYPDPDVAGTDDPDEIFIHAGRFGAQQIFSRYRNLPLKRLVPVEASIVSRSDSGQSNLALVTAFIQLAERTLLSSYAEKIEHGTRMRSDETLEKLGEDVVQSLKAYLEHLRTLPNVWSGNWDMPPDVE